MYKYYVEGRLEYFKSDNCFDINFSVFLEEKYVRFNAENFLSHIDDEDFLEKNDGKIVGIWFKCPIDFSHKLYKSMCWIYDEMDENTDIEYEIDSVIILQ